MHEIAMNLLDIMIVGFAVLLALVLLVPMLIVVWDTISAAIDIWRGKEVDL